jgi:hypothetical protein
MGIKGSVLLLALWLVVCEGVPATHADLGESAFDSDEIRLMERSELIQDDMAAHKSENAEVAGHKSDVKNLQKLLKESSEHEHKLEGVNEQERVRMRDKNKQLSDKNKRLSDKNLAARKAADTAWKAEGLMAAEVKALKKKVVLAKQATDSAWKAEAKAEFYGGDKVKIAKQASQLRADDKQLAADKAEIAKQASQLESDNQILSIQSEALASKQSLNTKRNVEEEKSQAFFHNMRKSKSDRKTRKVSKSKSDRENVPDAKVGKSKPDRKTIPEWRTDNNGIDIPELSK